MAGLPRELYLNAAMARRSAPAPAAPLSFTGRMAASARTSGFAAASVREAGLYTTVFAAKEKDSPAVAFFKDLAAGGISGSIAKTATAPIERVKLLIQTQDANPKARLASALRARNCAAAREK